MKPFFLQNEDIVKYVWNNKNWSVWKPFYFTLVNFIRFFFFFFFNCACAAPFLNMKNISKRVRQTSMHWYYYNIAYFVHTQRNYPRFSIYFRRKFQRPVYNLRNIVSMPLVWVNSKSESVCVKSLASSNKTYFRLQLRMHPHELFTFRGYLRFFEHKIPLSNDSSLM